MGWRLLQSLREQLPLVPKYELERQGGRKEKRENKTTIAVS